MTARGRPHYRVSVHIGSVAALATPEVNSHAAVSTGSTAVVQIDYSVASMTDPIPLVPERL